MARGDHAAHHDCDVSDTDEGLSTGFLPISLAVSLFVTGLFVLGFIPTSCEPSTTAPPAATP